MYPRTNYEMTEADLENLLSACKPTPVMMIGSYVGSTQQENANRAWAALGEKMGFDPMSVEPREGMGNRFFTAIPNETEFQKNERLTREAKEKKEARIIVLKREILERQMDLAEVERGAISSD